MPRRWPPHGRSRHGPPWARHGPPRHWGLRRRLTMAFIFVALAAVGLTTWLTLGALFSAQRDLFDMGAGHMAWNDPQFTAAREAFARVTRTAFFAGIASFFLASAAAGFVTRRLTRPLKALTDGAHRLAAGERGLTLRPPEAKDELRTLTEAFNALAQGLERQEAFRRTLVADIAHDLRTPLAVLRSEIEGMQDGVVAQDAGALERLHSEVMLLTRLVEDLRTLSLAEGGGMRLKVRDTPLAEFLPSVVERFRTRAAEAGVDLRLTPIPPALSAHCDPDALARVLGNLLDNALRYAAPGPVELGAAAAEDHVKLWLRDYGPGLKDAQLEAVFERFYRGDASRSTRKEGSGLGLAIARALTEAQGGRLEAAQPEGGGALFTLWLPQSIT